jgi:HYDIN/CFA65/VesB family protein
MRNTTINNIFNAAGKASAAFTISTGENKLSFAALILLLFFLLSSSGCIGLTGAGKPSGSSQTTAGAAAISLAPASVNFGHVAVGSTASQSVTISNGGGSSLTITQASTSAAGVSISGMSLPLVIAAGKQSTFDIVFSPKTAGALSGNISVMTDVSSTPSTVSLSGTALAATALLTSSAPSLNFGSVAVGKSGSMSVTLTNAGNSDVTVSKVSVSGGSFSESGVSAGMILAPGQSTTVDATFTPQSAGSVSGSVTVASNATNSPGTISLSGDGTQAPSQGVSHSVTLTWAPSSSAVAGYDVYRSEISGGPYSKLDPSVVPADTFVDSTVQAGLTYYYVVTSVSSGGTQSADSAQASATVPTP